MEVRGSTKIFVGENKTLSSENWEYQYNNVGFGQLTGFIPRVQEALNHSADNVKQYLTEGSMQYSTFEGPASLIEIYREGSITHLEGDYVGAQRFMRDLYLKIESLSEMDLALISQEIKDNQEVLHGIKPYRAKMLIKTPAYALLIPYFSQTPRFTWLESTIKH